MFNIGETVIIKRRKNINPKRIVGKIIKTTNINERLQYVVIENNSVHYCNPEMLLKI